MRVDDMEATGESQSKPTFVLSRWLYLRLLGFVHLTAFGSLAFQIIGLNGAAGIQPTAQMLARAWQQLGLEAIWYIPALQWLNSSDTCLLSLCWIGTALSLLVILGICTGPVLIVLMVMWLSLVSGGGEFTAFQSDGMLVEATFLTLFYVPWQWFEPPWPVPLRLKQQTPPPNISVWLLRIMVFRFMFASGLVKLLSGDPTWRDLTALDYHFETQPIPTPLAYYAHWLPKWLHKCFVISMYLSELVAPMLIFCGRIPRIVAAVLISSLHFGIALTGNYTFLSFLCIILCLSLVDDGVIAKLLPGRLVKAITEAQIAPSPKPIQGRIYQATAMTMIVVAVSQFFQTVARPFVPWPVKFVLATISPLRIADPYGLFAVMTTKRPEIVFEGTANGRLWRAYEFKYKPGDDLKRPPPWVAPHMPRLDWRLWFAAMEPVENNPYVLEIARQILCGSPNIQQFFVNNPFPGAPPILLRAYVYDYHFTWPDEHERTKAWWTRENRRVYLEPLACWHGELIKASEFNAIKSNDSTKTNDSTKSNDQAF
jgi:uncharacterized membrane protein YphA (DoxX/SURF4 family)